MRSATGIKGRFLALLDLTIIMLEDALDWMASRLGRANKRSKLTPLPTETCFFADIRLPTRDPLEAKAAAKLQLDQHAPCAPDALVYGLAKSADGTGWQVAMARFDQLDALNPSKGSEGFIVDSEAGGVAILRLPEQTEQWREGWMARIGVAFLLILAFLFLVTSASDWAQRRAEAFQAAETQLMAEATALRDATNQTVSQAALTERAALPDLIDLLARIQAAKPEAWVFRQYEWAGGQLSVVFDEASTEQVSPARYAPAFREALGASDIALTRQRMGSGRSQIRLVVTLEEDSV